MNPICLPLKKYILFSLTLSILLLSLSSCKQEDEGNESNETEELLLRLPPQSYQAINLEGTVGFWAHDGINKYTVNIFIPESIDGQVTGFVEDMPSDFQTIGTTVIFSGDYTTALDTPSVVFGGQQIYSLKLSSIRLK